MSAIPSIPAAIVTLEQLDRWIDANAPKMAGLADRLRMTVAVMDRAGEIGACRRARGE